MPIRNVVLFITDGHRADMLGCAGNDLACTPNIDALADVGVVCRNAFCSHSVCMPTRATIFTGRYPHVHGVWANGVALSTTELTLPQVLRESGWATCASGKVHFEPLQAYPDYISPRIEGPEPYYGFDEVHLSENSIGQEYLDYVELHCPQWLDNARNRRGTVPPEHHELQWITTQAREFVTDRAAAGQPFFCVCSFHELSPPCFAPDGYAGRCDPGAVTVPVLDDDDLARRPPFYRQCYEGYVRHGKQPDEHSLRRAIASCHDQLAFIDVQFGRVITALHETGVWDDTLVLFAADHGLSLNDHFQWRHGPFLFDEVIRVPMIWHVPGMTGVPGTVDGLVESVDIMPTVLDFCGVPCPSGVQGRSLLPLLGGDPGAVGRESVLVQERCAPDLAARGVAPETVNLVGVRTEDWKLIVCQGTPHGELYDLREDPGEFRNLWNDPGHKRIQTELTDLLSTQFTGARDPLPDRQYDW